MNLKITSGVALLAMTVLSGSAMAAGGQSSVGVPSLPSKGHFSVTPEGGTNFNVGGEFVKSDTQYWDGVTIGGQAMTATSVSVKSESFSDVYEAPIVAGLSFGYGLSDRDEVSAVLRYMHASAKSFTALHVNGTGTFGANTYTDTDLNGKFSDYSEYGLEGNYRHFFALGSGKSFHPYVGGLIGVKRTGDINLDVTDQSGNAVLSGAKFYKAGFSWSSGLEVGFRYDVTKNLALGLETGFRIEGNLQENNDELSKVNSAGNRWDIPVQVGLTYKF